MAQRKRSTLEQLVYQCTQVDATGAPRDLSACRELLRRAIYAHDDRAWDAIVPHLRAFVLRRIYAQRPEINPQEAERLIFHTLTDFLTHLHGQPDLVQRFPTYPVLLALLDSSLTHHL